MMQKVNRTEAGYLKHKRKRENLKTVILFALPLVLFAAGFVTTKSRLNLLTVVAVCGMLPASKSLVSSIMYIKAHGISEADYNRVVHFTEKQLGAYDNIFTTYEKTYEVPSIVVRNGNVCGYVHNTYKTLGELEKHLTTCIKKEGYSVNVKIFDNIDAYIKRLESLNKLEENQPETDKAILHILFEVSL